MLIKDLSDCRAEADGVILICRSMWTVGLVQVCSLQQTSLLVSQQYLTLLVKSGIRLQIVLYRSAVVSSDPIQSYDKTLCHCQLTNTNRDDQKVNCSDPGQSLQNQKNEENNFWVKWMLTLFSSRSKIRIRTEKKNNLLWKFRVYIRSDPFPKMCAIFAHDDKSAHK